MADLLAQRVSAGECGQVYAVCKGRPVKSEDSERVNLVCVRDTAEEAQELANQFEVAQRYVMFLEYLSAIKVKTGGSAALAQVNNEASFAEFTDKYEFNKEGQPRLYYVQKIRIVDKLADADKSGGGGK